jgi:hypothetical protein
LALKETPLFTGESLVAHRGESATQVKPLRLPALRIITGHNIKLLCFRAKEVLDMMARPNQVMWKSTRPETAGVAHPKIP